MYIVYEYIYIYIYAHTHTYMYVHLCVYICVCIYIYIYLAELQQAVRASGAANLRPQTLKFSFIDLGAIWDTH